MSMYEFDMPSSTYFEFETLKPWHKWFAWKPTNINGKKVWLKFIYRRQLTSILKDKLLSPNWGLRYFDKHWEYAEHAFEILKREDYPKFVERYKR